MARRDASGLKGSIVGVRWPVRRSSFIVLCWSSHSTYGNLSQSCAVPTRRDCLVCDTAPTTEFIPPRPSGEGARANQLDRNRNAGGGF